ncbi:Ig-like domain-containing protein [Polaribacter sp.]|nr:Ig-like domain-containing protein [Polaribacter sp.]
MFKKDRIYKTITKILAIFVVILCSAFILFPQDKKITNTSQKEGVHAPFNKQYKPEELGKVLSWIDCGKGLSAVSYHRGLMLAPMSYDFGGGLGDGAFVAYNIDDPTKPYSVFDSREYPEIYHTEGKKDYLGDIAENHGMYFHKDLVLFSERGYNRTGFMILDLAPLYDNDPKTLPKIVSRYHFPDVEKTTVYDGFSFAPTWAGGRYLYAPTGSNGLYIVDTQNLDEPKLLAHLRKDQLYNQTLRSANVIGDLLILSPAAIASDDVDIVLIDVSNPSFPNLLNHHTIKTGYQGTIYGSRFYNGAFSGNRGADKTSEIIAYDFSDPMNVKNINLTKTEKLFKPEYLFLQDDNLFIGHYPGLSKWKTENDKLTFDVAIEPEHPKANDYAFVSPLGNLSIVTSDHIVESRINIGVHQIEPDLKGPELKYVLPKKNAKNVSKLTKIGISLSDFTSNETLTDDAIYIQERGTNSKVPADLGHGLGIVHAIPKKPLKDNTTYDVYITKNLKDMVGNSFEGESLITSFSTGTTLADYSCEINTDLPKVVGKKVTIKAIINNKKLADKLQYAWNFGDGTANTEFSKKSFITKKFNKPGNYNITLMTKQKGSDKIIKSTSVQVVHASLPKSKPVSSSSLFFDENTDKLYVVNPDNNTFTAINSKSGKVIYEQETPKNPVAIIGIENKIWITSKKDDKITIYNAEDGSFVKTINLNYGSSPHGITYNQFNNKCYVALTALGQLQEINTKNYTLERNIQLDGSLRNVSFVPEKNIVVAPQFIASNQKGAKVEWVDLKSWKVSFSETLKPSLENDGLANGRGFPNYLGPIAVNPEQTKIWIPGKKDNLLRGLRRDGNPLVFDHTVRSLAVSIDLNKEKEIEEDRIDLDNNDFACAATYNPFGNILYVATMGSQIIMAVDAYNPGNQSIFNSYGEGTNALTMDTDGSKLYVHNQLSRVVSVFDSKPDGELKFNTKWKTVAKEILSEDVLEGKKLFHNTTRSSMSQEGYMSCASCHIDGSSDKRVWDISNLGEGFRNTIDLRGKAGMKHGMLHWSGNFDEVQDFDNQIQALNEGTGFVFDKITRNHPQLFSSKYGLHRELDNLAKYVASLNEYPKSPYKNKDGSFTANAKKGRKHFIDLKCYTCHSGSTFTDSKLRKLHNVGTIKETSGNRLKGDLLGLDTPTLISIWDTAPYLHDGSAKTLKDVFSVGNLPEAAVHQSANTLGKKEFNELMEYIMQLDSEDGVTTKDIGSKNTNPVFEKEVYTFNYTYRYDKRVHPIGKIKAFDADKNQTISYKLAPSGGAGFFSVDAENGKINFDYKDIYFRHRFNAPYQTKKTYWFNVMALNNDNFPNQIETRVVVNVTYPKIEIPWKELNELKKINILLDKGKKISQHQTERLKILNRKVVKVLKGEVEQSIH